MISKIKLNFFIILLIIFIVLLTIFLFFLLKNYFDFLGAKYLIFSKIEQFSKDLKNNNETSITLGIDDDNIMKLPTVIYDKNNNIIALYSSQKHRLVPLKDIPVFLSKGFILIEDRSFYSHFGINPIRFLFGIINNIITLGHSPGGSTITQQLAKILFTKQERTIKRKIFEFFCSIELEKRFTKNEILTIYLNSIYLGHGTYGVEDASNFYFGKSVTELNIGEAALLIGMNRSPERYSPIKNKNNAIKIQTFVLNKFLESGLISKKDISYEIDKFWNNFYNKINIGNQSFWKTDINNSGYLTEYVRQILEKEFSYDKIVEGGLIIETSFDIKKQMIAEEIIKKDLIYIKDKILKTSEELKLKNYNSELLNRVEATLVSIDYNSGEVLVMVGGSGYSYANQLNRAINSKRQIGSAVKPFIYSYALNNKVLKDKYIHPFTKFKDELNTYIIDGKKYTPTNFNKKHIYGNMVTLYDALKESLNTIAVSILNDMNIKDVANYIREACLIDSTDDKKRIPEVLSLALGTCELSTLELAVAYSIFPRLGKTLYPVTIKKISDNKGNVYYDYTKINNYYFNFLYPEKNREPKQLINKEVAYEMVQMMKGVFEKGGTAYWTAYKTGFNINASAKSGTTQNFNDGWFAGFSGNEVCVTWVGIDTNESILLSSESNAAIIWCDYMKQISLTSQNQIEIPENMILLNICKDTGLISTPFCQNTINFYFWNDGPLPEKCYIHDKSIDIF